MRTDLEINNTTNKDVQIIVVVVMISSINTIQYGNRFCIITAIINETIVNRTGKIP